LLVPLIWCVVVEAMRSLATQDGDGAPLESGAELRVLAIMLAPVLVGGLCLAWAAAPKPYALPPLLPETHFFVEAPVAARAAHIAQAAPTVDWFGVVALAIVIAYALGFTWCAVRLGFAQWRVARIAARAVDASEIWGAGVSVTEARVSAFVG